MKIGVVGPGAVGSFYGAKLWRDGHEVHFLLRSDYEVVRRRGLKVKSFEGDFHANPKAAKTPQDIGVCDLVLVALKSTANDRFAELITPLVGEKTAILTLQNGLGNEEQLAALFGGEKILGGLCFVCLNRTEPGVIHHIAHGKVDIGEFSGWPEPRTHEIASAFRHAGVPCSVGENLQCARWEKLVWNIPFNGLGVASCAGLEAFRNSSAPIKRQSPCLTTDLLLDNGFWEGWVRALMREVIDAARAKGLKLEYDLIEDRIGKTRGMGPYKPSTLIDFERGAEIELQSLFLEPLRQAQAAVAGCPRLARLCEILSSVA